MTLRTKKPLVKIVTWIIVILLIIAVFSPFIGYIFTSDLTNQTGVETTGTTTITGDFTQ